MNYIHICILNFVPTGNNGKLKKKSKTRRILVGKCNFTRINNNLKRHCIYYKFKYVYAQLRVLIWLIYV